MKAFLLRNSLPELLEDWKFAWPISVIALYISLVFFSPEIIPQISLSRTDVYTSNTFRHFSNKKSSELLLKTILRDQTVKTTKIWQEMLSKSFYELLQMPSLIWTIRRFSEIFVSTVTKNITAIIKFWFHRQKSILKFDNKFLLFTHMSSLVHHSFVRSKIS